MIEHFTDRVEGIGLLEAAMEQKRAFMATSGRGSEDQTIVYGISKSLKEVGEEMLVEDRHRGYIVLSVNAVSSPVLISS